MTGHYDYYSTSITWDFDNNTAQGWDIKAVGGASGLVVDSDHYHSGAYSIRDNDHTTGSSASTCWANLIAGNYVPYISWTFPAQITSCNITFWNLLSSIASLDANSRAIGCKLAFAGNGTQIFNDLNTGLAINTNWVQSEVWDLTASVDAWNTATSVKIYLGQCASWGGSNWGEWVASHYDDIVLKYTYRVWVPSPGLPLGNMKNVLAVCAFFGLIAGPAYGIYQVKEHEFVKAVTWGPVIFFTSVTLLMVTI
jgi:hypothetical protein